MSKTEFVSVAEAREILGVSEPKMARMLADGTLKWEPNPVDRRGKIIRRRDVEMLTARMPARMGKDAA